MTKVLTLPQLIEKSDALRAAGKKLVFTNGAFDILHAGHVRYLRAARALGEALAVAVNSDASVRALKGPSRPVNPESDRAEIVAALECVDFVILFNEPRVTELLRAARPAIYVKGGDYTPETLDREERAVLEEAGAEIRIVPFENGYSTSRLIERVKGSST